MKRRRTVLMFEDVDDYVLAVKRKAASGDPPEWLLASMDVFEHNYSNVITYSTIIRAIVRRSLALDGQERANRR